MKKYIHVNQHVLKSNRKTGEREPPITCKTYKDNTYGQSVAIMHNGEEVARIVYSPDKPLSCGAHVWVETQCDVVIE